MGNDSYRTQFDYLLNAFEEASQSDDPAGHNYRAKREALFKYVRDLENSSNGPSMPAEPTMGMWDDFCEVYKVPFDAFEQAYKAMRAGYVRDLIYCPRPWTGDDGTIKDCLSRGHCGCNHSTDATKSGADNE